MKRVDELIAGTASHHLFPFFWQKGQDVETTRLYVRKMHEQGLRGFCVESRPHPDFCGDGWWETMDAIIDEAKSLGMKIWILDDVSFPTGAANHKVPDELKKRYLACHRFDFEGDGQPRQLNVAMLAGMRAMADQRHREDRLVAAVLAPKHTEAKDAFAEGALLDVTAAAQSGLLELPAVRGPHSLFALYETPCGADNATKDHLDPMRAEATQVLLNEVYEPHYAHYADEFGTTILAFFSDEPRFGNGPDRNELVGQTSSPLPWNAGVQAALQERGVAAAELAFLFGGESERAAQVRFTYMDVVTRLYSENFTQVIGAWCREHGVAYLGHVIEDDNAHARLAQGPGHYFRGIAGQDAAGIDVIGGQVVPGMDYHHDAFSRGGSDGEFYHYALARMGASAAKLDPRKGGRLMCEAFGAYGWCEGLRMMKWITDHLICHGVNLIVPHAFDPAPFPDWDCPPHFYAHGNNPQYPEFHQLAEYADRLCHLFSGGAKVARIGVLYHAFAEWGGAAQPFQKACKALQQAQLDSDVISEDHLLAAELGAGTYTINGFAYDALVVAQAERLPEALVARLAELDRAGVDVVFAGAQPTACAGFGREASLTELPASLEQLRDVRVSEDVPHLVAYHYTQPDGSAWMFFNESVADSVDVQVDVGESGPLAVYDAFANRLYALDAQAGSFRLQLAPYESLVVVSAEGGEPRKEAGEVLAEVPAASVALRAYNEAEFGPEAPFAFGKDQVDSGFSGTLRYRFGLDLARADVALRLGGVYETSRVWVNGEPVGASIMPNPTFDLSAAARKGANEVLVEVTNTLVHALHDPFSMYLPIDPSGITGKVELVAYA